jgi:CBS domain containing-hemolysin-like protein
MAGSTWAIVAILILANSLYVAAEFGAVGVRRSRVRRLAEDGNWLARRLLPYVETPSTLDRYVGTSQIGITVSGLTLGAFAQATFALALAPVLTARFGLAPVTAVSAAAVVVLVVLTAVQLVLGELVPKAIALQYPTETALATVLPMQWSLAVFRPVIKLLNGAALLLLRLFGADDHGHHHLHSPEEIDLLIAESRDGGLLEPEEQQRLRRALQLGLRTARDLLVPLDRLTMVDARATWEEVVATVAASPFSRLPVYRGTRDHIIGLLRVKDLVDRYVVEGPLPLERLMRPVVQVPATLAADRVLALLRERRVHAAVVADATGRALGLITIQDVLTELLGSAARPAVPPGTARTKK